MKVLVLGSGVIGVASAWYLAADGHEVTLVDRQPGPGLETSFANGGQVSASHAEPWARPAVLPKILKWIGRDDAPLVFRARADWAQWRWGLGFLRECLPGRFEGNTRALGIAREVKTPQQCVAIEPALRGVPLAGGIYTPDDESGDAYLFTRALAGKCREAGVRFVSDTILGIDPVAGVRTERQTLQADAYVVSLGSYSPLLLAPLGIRIPVYIRCNAIVERVREFFPALRAIEPSHRWAGLRPATPGNAPLIGRTRLANLFLNTGHGTLGWTLACGSGRALADIVSGHEPAVPLAFQR